MKSIMLNVFSFVKFLFICFRETYGDNIEMYYYNHYEFVYGISFICSRNMWKLIYY